MDDVIFIIILPGFSFVFLKTTKILCKLHILIIYSQNSDRPLHSSLVNTADEYNLPRSLECFDEILVKSKVFVLVSITMLKS